MKLEEIVFALSGLTEEQREEVYANSSDQLWVPNPGPQTDAYFCEADELFYGGSAGGGKTDLSLGLAITEHKRSLVLRRTNRETLGLVERLTEILGTRDGFNSQTGAWRIGNKLVELGGCQLEEDKQKYKGFPKDLICFDEVSDFSESQYRFIIGWNRSTDKHQRCRVVAAGNPPTRPEGLWVIKRWAAWLDPTHHNPAEPGELRWYTTIDGLDTEVDGHGPHIINGEEVFARSRTFIRAKLSDNPDQDNPEYRAVLAGHPEEYRAAYRDGDFGVGLRDDPYQAIPTEWIRAAQARWTARPPVGVPMCAIGVDVAQGGLDNSVLAPRHDGWYDKLIKIPGKLTPSGKELAGYIVANRRDGAEVTIDLGGGWGGDALSCLKDNGIDPKIYMGVKPSTKRTQDGKLRFFNVRTEAYWCFREGLDPSQPQGSTIALPASATLVADLCAPTYQIVRPNILKLESKEDVTKRIGRSPDEGDAVVMAWFHGTKVANVAGGWGGRKTMPKVIMGRQR